MLRCHKRQAKKVAPLCRWLGAAENIIFYNQAKKQSCSCSLSFCHSNFSPLLSRNSSNYCKYPKMKTYLLGDIKYLAYLECNNILISLQPLELSAGPIFLMWKCKSAFLRPCWYRSNCKQNAVTVLFLNTTPDWNYLHSTLKNAPSSSHLQ